MNGAQTELTFTDATWDAAQTVTVRADGDADAQADEATLTHRGGYAGAAPEETVNVADDEAGVELSQQVVTVQGGARNTYMVRLVAQPAGPVMSPDSDVEVGSAESPGSRALVFMATTWQTSQAVTVRLPADPLIEGTEATAEGRIEDDTERARQRSLGMVLAGVGRTLAPDVVDVIGDRFLRQPTRNQVTVGGQALTLDCDPQTRRWRQATGAAYGVARALGVEVGSPLGGAATGSSDTCAGRRGAR